MAIVPTVEPRTAISHGSVPYSNDLPFITVREGFARGTDLYEMSSRRHSIETRVEGLILVMIHGDIIHRKLVHESILIFRTSEPVMKECGSIRYLANDLIFILVETANGVRIQTREERFIKEFDGDLDTDLAHISTSRSRPASATAMKLAKE